MRGATIERLRRVAATTTVGVPTKRVPLGRFLLVALQLALVTSGCADDSLASRGTANESRVPTTPLEPYAGRMAELFDDAIEPSAAGFAFGVATESDPVATLRERTQRSDTVALARVVTVTSGRGSDGRGWQVVLKTLEPLAGAPPPETFSWLIRSIDPAAGIVRASETQMVGTTLVAFLRAFAGTPGSDGAPTRRIHFHAAADSKSERDAVRAAAALGEFR
jgi:hypothetical protein